LSFVVVVLCHPERSRGTPDFSECQPTHPNHGAIEVRPQKVATFRIIQTGERQRHHSMSG
jgi:hypothetical protein